MIRVLGAESARSTLEAVFTASFFVARGYMAGDILTKMTYCDIIIYVVINKVFYFFVCV